MAEPRQTLISTSLCTPFLLSLVGALWVSGSCVQEDRLITLVSLMTVKSVALRTGGHHSLHLRSEAFLQNLRVFTGKLSPR